jgi:hypothetical protein
MTVDEFSAFVVPDAGLLIHRKEAAGSREVA